jgi:CRISPR-associated endonuclease/helicase Cas3
MKPSPYPNELDSIWAKSPEKGEGGQAESLAQHTWVVLERLAEFIRLRPELPSNLGREDLWHLLYWATFFHDFGKAAPAFQDLLHGKNDAKEKWQKHRHEVFSLMFLDWITDGLTPVQMQWVQAAIVSHHRDPEDIETLYPPVLPDEEDPLTAQISGLECNTIKGLWQWLNDSSTQWISKLGLANMGILPLHFLPQAQAINSIIPNGSQSIRSHLKSYRRFTTSISEKDQYFWVQLIALRGYIINADHGGSAHVEPLAYLHFSPHDVIEKCNIRIENLFAHQQRANNSSGSALLIAPTGSGKTEAAMLWAANQTLKAGSTSRLFYTLPYQASMNAMYLRLQEIFGEGDVGLQHGRGLLALYHQLMDRNYTVQDAIQNAKSMRNLANLNHPAVRVFSPYQMLKWMYRIKGYEAQLSDYHNALFILDEIHAYEVKRLALILKTVQYLRQYYHANFFVMSATFPSMVKKWLNDALDNPQEIMAEPDLFREFQRHKLEIIDGDLLNTINLDKIAQTVKSGQSTLVVCNLVLRAQEAYEQLKSRLEGFNIPVILLHGRFNMQDRSKKEAFIREKVATRRASNLTPILLVATQVVEVSLDIDLNTIYTDPAPLEALVQRFGRVNRGRKIKPYAIVHVFTRPDDGQKIYEQELVREALRILQREDNRPIDESKIGTWLDEIYTGKIAERWQAEYAKAAQEFEQVCVNTLRPFETDTVLEEQFYKAFDGIDVLPESLYDEYLQRKDQQPILADELLVPISWGRYKSLQNKGLVLPHDKTIPPIVKAKYSTEIGLTYEAQPNPDIWD